MNRMQNFKNGLIKDNPVFGLYLGLCSTLAITTSINNAIGMGRCGYFRFDLIEHDHFSNPQISTR